MRPLSCADARALVDARLDGRLPSGDDAALRTHLEACAPCAAVAADARRVHSALLALHPGDPGPEFTERVIAALDRGPAPGEAAIPAPRGRFAAAVAGAAATTALAAAAVALLPVEEAAASVASRIPLLASPVPALPEPATRLLAGIGTAVPVWAAAAAGAAALLGAFLAGRSARP